MNRFKQPVMAVAGGIAAALVIATLPHVYLENIIGATGLSEFIPAAAPPLGNTARGLVAVMTGMISTSAIYLFLNHKPKFLGGGSDMSLAIRKNLTTNAIDDVRGGKSRFTMPKLNLSAKTLTKFLKKPKKVAGQVTDLRDLPDIKPADRHPDAPARHPIFASSDLGAPLAEKIKKFDDVAVEQNLAEPVEEFAPSISSGAPFVAEKMMDSPSEKEMTFDRPEDVSPQEKPSAPREDLTTLSLAQLADRLEAGLRRLEVLEKREQVAPPPPIAEPAPTVEKTVTLAEVSQAPAPLAMPPLRSVDSDEPVAQDNRQADMDAALKAALGTLEKMTVQR
ncbi:hypothetical protein [uncultured Parasphingorhabdus sp.]|uniref:hypothetical protein n=1 Tax=uncultured Parasphingorhabdus sp. TaxID=2709694 RepID=UPI0030DB613E|tara:strand:+ start:21132 stop:22139 length:1008 start_codon:yes stop_codon:yes gene_type:complete